MQELPLIRFVEIGKVIKPRGLKGEVKCQGEMLNIKTVKSIYLENKPFKILKKSEYDGFVYLYLDGIDTIETADRLRDKKILVERSALGLSDDEVLTSELVGFDVVTQNGKRLGKIKSIENYGAGEICDLGNYSFPYEDAFVIETDMTTQTMTIKDQEEYQ